MIEDLDAGEFQQKEDKSEAELSATDINNDLVEDVRRNILVKIDEYNEKISREELSLSAMKDLVGRNKKVLTEIHKEKEEFLEKLRMEKELFEKKQEQEKIEYIKQFK